VVSNGPHQVVRRYSAPMAAAAAAVSSTAVVKAPCALLLNVTSTDTWIQLTSHIVGHSACAMN
jgi:hypothetical protein